jgi:hypothetical protein
VKIATAVMCVLVAASAVALAAGGPTPDKHPLLPGEPAYDGREGGETIATAFPIPALPYYDAGATCDNLNDYDEACPYTGSTSPDVVYVYTPAENQDITIGLCNSFYDTKVYVYDDAGALLACNDDFPGCGPNGWRSKIECLGVPGGLNLYIVVDGYGGDCGDYELNVYLCGSPVEETTWGTIKVLYR